MKFITEFTLCITKYVNFLYYMIEKCVVSNDRQLIDLTSYIPCY